MSSILFLASKSPQRQALLQEIQIPFVLLEQDANEHACDWGLPFMQLLESIATYKMDHVILPVGKQDETIFVLTADTMGQDLHGTIHGKPRNKEDALAKIKALRAGGSVATAFCLDKKIYNNGNWQLQQRIIRCVETFYTFDMPDHWIERYLNAEPHYLHISGAIDVTGYGQQFLKTLHGSYSTIIGLPLFELRQSLEEIGFIIQR